MPTKKRAPRKKAPDADIEWYLKDDRSDIAKEWLATQDNPGSIHTCYRSGNEPAMMAERMGYKAALVEGKQIGHKGDLLWYCDSEDSRKMRDAPAKIAKEQLIAQSDTDTNPDYQGVSRQ